QPVPSRGRPARPQSRITPAGLLRRTHRDDARAPPYPRPRARPSGGNRARPKPPGAASGTPRTRGGLLWSRPTRRRRRRAPAILIAGQRIPRGLPRGDGEEPPLAGHTLELMRTAVLEV